MESFDVRDHETHEHDRSRRQCDWRKKGRRGRSAAHRRDLPQKSTPKTKSETEHAIARMHCERCHAFQRSRVSIYSNSYKGREAGEAALNVQFDHGDRLRPLPKPPSSLKTTKSVQERLGAVNRPLPLPSSALSRHQGRKYAHTLVQNMQLFVREQHGCPSGVVLPASWKRCVCNRFFFSVSVYACL